MRATKSQPFIVSHHGLQGAGKKIAHPLSNDVPKSWV
jgi:hypothetical protein